MRKIFLVIISTFSLLSFSELDSLNQLQKQAADLASGASSGSRDLEAADYLMGKFKFGEEGKPTWYPEFYPRWSDMEPGSGVRPRLKLFKPVAEGSTLLAPLFEVFKKKNPSGNCEINLNPPFLSFASIEGTEYCMEEAKQYDVDKTTLASLQKLTNLSDPAQVQSAFVSVFNMDALSEVQRNKLMTDPNASIRTILDSLSSDAEKQALVDPRRIQLLKYNAHKDYPLGLGSISAQVGSMTVDIPVDLPPEPECRLEVSMGQNEPFNPGSAVKFDLLVNSLALSASYTGSHTNEEIFIDLTSQAYPSSHFGEWRKVVDFHYEIPEDVSMLEMAENTNDEVIWSVTAKVSGVTGVTSSVDCPVTKVRVNRPPPPRCILAARNPQVLPGETTDINIDCSTGGPVNTLVVAGKQLRVSNGKAVMKYSRKTLVSAEKIEGRAEGPGGVSTTETYLGAVCRFNDPYTTHQTRGRTFRRAHLYYPGFQTYEVTGYVRYGWAGGIYLHCSPDSFCMNNDVPGKGRHHVIQIGPKTDPNCQEEQYQIRWAGCFTPDTQIKMANGSLKLASDIHENDYVFNPHYNTGIRVRKVVKGPEKKSLYEVKTSKGKVEVTEDHPFLTARGWVQAMTLKKGDKLLGNGEPKLVSRVKKLKYQGPQDVWNFELDTEDPMAHVVIANGIPTGDLVTQLELKKPKTKLP